MPERVVGSAVDSQVKENRWLPLPTGSMCVSGGVTARGVGAEILPSEVGGGGIVAARLGVVVLGSMVSGGVVVPVEGPAFAGNRKGTECGLSSVPPLILGLVVFKKKNGFERLRKGGDILALFLMVRMY